MGISLISLDIAAFADVANLAFEAYLVDIDPGAELSIRDLVYSLLMECAGGDNVDPDKNQPISDMPMITVDASGARPVVQRISPNPQARALANEIKLCDSNRCRLGNWVPWDTDDLVRMVQFRMDQLLDAQFDGVLSKSAPKEPVRPPKLDSTRYRLPNGKDLTTIRFMEGDPQEFMLPQFDIASLNAGGKQFVLMEAGAFEKFCQNLIDTERAAFATQEVAMAAEEIVAMSKSPNERKPTKTPRAPTPREPSAKPPRKPYSIPPDVDNDRVDKWVRPL